MKALRVDLPTMSVLQDCVRAVHLCPSSWSCHPTAGLSEGHDAYRQETVFHLVGWEQVVWEYPGRVVLAEQRRESLALDDLYVLRLHG